MSAMYGLPYFPAHSPIHYCCIVVGEIKRWRGGKWASEPRRVWIDDLEREGWSALTWSSYFQVLIQLILWVGLLVWETAKIVSLKASMTKAWNNINKRHLNNISQSHESYLLPLKFSAWIIHYFEYIWNQNSRNSNIPWSKSNRDRDLLYWRRCQSEDFSEF